MLPRVILHNALSLDGRMDGFAADLEQYYGLIGQWKEDATLSGSQTILAMPDEVPPEDDSAFEPPEYSPGDERALLVIPDSLGRVRCWHYLRQLPYWRDWVALVSETTPKDYLDYLQKRHIRFHVVGKDKVDFRAALEALNTCYGVKTVRMDSGGILNGVLLRAGLVSEISVLVYPVMVGGTSQRSLFHAPDLTGPEGVIPLKLVHVEQFPNQAVWLRYEVVK